MKTPDRCGCEFLPNVFCFALKTTSTNKHRPKLLQCVLFCTYNQTVMLIVLKHSAKHSGPVILFNVESELYTLLLCKLYWTFLCFCRGISLLETRQCQIFKLLTHHLVGIFLDVAGKFKLHVIII